MSEEKKKPESSGSGTDYPWAELEDDDAPEDKGTAPIDRKKKTSRAAWGRDDSELRREMLQFHEAAVADPDHDDDWPEAPPDDGGAPAAVAPRTAPA